MAEFTENGASGPLDKEKSLASDRALLDKSLITVRRYVAHANQTGQSIDLLLNGSVHAFADVMRNRIKEHFESQNRVSFAKTKIPTICYNKTNEGKSAYEILHRYRFKQEIAPAITEVKSEGFVLVDTGSRFDDDYKGYDPLKVEAMEETYIPKEVFWRILYMYSKDKIIKFYRYCCRLIPEWCKPRAWLEKIRKLLLKLLYKLISRKFFENTRKAYDGAIEKAGEVYSLFPDWYRNNARLINTALGLMIIVGVVTHGKLTKDTPAKWEDKPYNNYTGNSELKRALRVESTEFRLPSEFNETINKYEADLDCAGSYKRVAKRGDMVWENLQHITPPVHTGTPLSLFKSLGKNIRRCRVDAGYLSEEGKALSTKTYLLGLCGNYALINRHVMSKSFVGTRIQVLTAGGMLDPNLVGPSKMTVIQENDFRWIGGDLVLVRLNLPSPFSNIMCHLSNTEFPVHTTGTVGDTPLDVFYLAEKHPLIDPHLGVYDLDEFFYYYWQKHGQGACGLPVIATIGKGAAIVGFHSAGAGKDSDSHPHFCAASVVRLNEVQQAITDMGGDFLYVQASESSDFEFFGDPGVKSMFHFEELYKLEYYGKTGDSVHMNNKSKIEIMPFRDEIKEVLESSGLTIDKEFGLPLMTQRGSGPTYQNPFNRAARKLAKPNKCLDKRILARVHAEIVEKLLTVFPSSLKPYDLTVAINGYNDDQFFRRMNASTSSGYGWDGPKSKYIPLISELPDCIREPCPELKKRIAECLKRLGRGEIMRCLTKAALKDEPREMKKVLEGNTRVFYVSALECVIISRMLLGPFYTHLVEFGEVIGCMVGTNILQSAERLVTELNNFSSKVFDGDWGSFDTSIPMDVSWTAGSVIHTVLKARGYNDYALRMVRGILTGELYPTIVMNGDVFTAPGLQASGAYGTAEMNSVKNVVATMYNYYSRVELMQTYFFDNVVFKNYGDDGLFAVKDKIIHLFNNAIFKDLSLVNLDMEYTSAAKEGVMLPYVGMSEVSFLKRKFVYKREFSRHVPVLDPNSIYKCLTMSLPSKSVSVEQQMESSFISAQLELFLHLDATTFITITKQLEGIFTRHFYKGGGSWQFPKSREDLVKDLKY
jgi:hypothetical protein